MPIHRREVLGVSLAAAAATTVPRRPAWAASEPVKVVLTRGVSGLIINEVISAQGYFDTFGINPDMLVVADGTKCIAALVSGSAQICIFSGFNQLLPAIERGAALKILAGSLNVPSLAMYSGKAGIKSVKDLQGKAIGIGAAGSVLYQMTVLLLRKYGVDVSSVTFQNVGSNADILRAVSAGTVDAGLADVDVFDQQSQFGIHALANGLLWKELPQYTNQASYASADAIKAHRDLLVRVLAAYCKGYRYICSPASRQAFITARLKVTQETSPQRALTEWNWIQTTQPYAVNLGLSDAQIDFVQQANVNTGVQKKVMAPASIADFSLARDALKLVQAS